jgi:hypothetical protein
MPEIGSMNFYMVWFIIVAILIGVIGTWKLYQNDRSITALLFLIGAILVFVFYGLRWFGSGATAFNPAPAQWPPYINTCPDYLVYYKRTKNNVQQDTCIDRIGVSRNSALKVFPASGEPPSDDSYYFDLSTKTEDPVKKRTELCQRTIEFGLTWEGVSDGETCYSLDGSSTNVPGPSDGSSCPSS